jgi:uncharacterized protein YdeI (BOF family)
MKRLLLVVTVLAIATPALADEVGVHVGPVGAGVTVGDGHRDYDRDRTTVIKEREPSDRTTVIKKDHDDGTRTKTVIHERD